MPDNHELNIQGNQNTVFQGVSITNGEINVNPLDTDAVVAKIAEAFGTKLEHTLNIIIVSSSAAAWKPFQSSEAQAPTITELLTSYGKQSGFDIDAVIVNKMKIDDVELKAHIKDDISPHVILIIDAFALSEIENQDFVSIFDGKGSGIGGCIIPSCMMLTDEKQKEIHAYMLHHLGHLHTCFESRFKKEYMYIEMGVPTPERFFRRLTNIAIKHLELNPRTVKWSETFRSRRGSTSITHLKPTIDA